MPCLSLIREVLIVSDEHPNVVRCFAMEEDREFVYLALEKCRCTLSDWVNSAEGKVCVGTSACAAGNGVWALCAPVATVDSRRCKACLE